MSEPPRLLADRYELQAELGRGGMATVHRALDRRLGRPVAIKVLAEWLARDPVYLARFRREAQAAAGLSHPGIVRIYDTGSDGDTHFIAMELIEGRTLEDVLSAEAPQEPDRAVSIAIDVAAALQAAHERGIVHRDVKPANVMITEDGAVKVTDFGIARGGTSSTLTQTGTVFGTARYLAPEQARGERADARADVYSLGVVLYEMLAGRPPFSGDSPLAVAMQHVNDTPPPLAGMRAGIPVELDAAVMRAMAKDPEDRYGSAGELRSALAAAAPGPIDATVPVTPPRSGTTTPMEPVDEEPPRRRLARALWLTALGLAGIALLLLLPVLLGDEGTPERTAGSPRATSPSPEPSPTETSPPPSPSPEPSPEPEGTSIGDAAAALAAEIDAGKDAGEIEPKVAAELDKELRDALKELDEGEPDKALEKLDELRDKVEEKLEKGEITSEARAEAILDRVDALEEAIIRTVGDEAGD